MKISQEFAKENFDKVLEWLSTDRDEAGARFENIRDGLIRYFRLKGCHDAETLADESMNRVIKRIDTLDLTTGASKPSIFYGFARNVFREFIRFEKNRTIQLNEELKQTLVGSVMFSENPAIDCLRECVSHLDILDGKLIVDYYIEVGQSKVSARQQLALHNELTIGALHTRIHRIKGILRPCVEKCTKAGKTVRN